MRRFRTPPFELDGTLTLLFNGDYFGSMVARLTERGFCTFLGSTVCAALAAAILAVKAARSNFGFAAGGFAFPFSMSLLF